MSEARLATGLAPAGAEASFEAAVAQLKELVDGDVDDELLRQRLQASGGSVQHAANSYFQGQQQRQQQEQNDIEVGSIWEVDLAFGGLDWQSKNQPAFREARITGVRPHDLVDIEWLQHGMPEGAQQGRGDK